MHSLKELRAENAAKRLSDSRTVGEDEVAATNASSSAAAAAAAAAAVAATVPRTGRTLAPLSSSGSSLPSSAATLTVDPAAEADTKRQQERDARRRRRLRRQREREQRENEDDNSKENNDDSATAVSGTSRTSTTPRETMVEGVIPAGGSMAGENRGGDSAVQRTRDSESKSEQFEEGPRLHQSPAGGPADSEENVRDDKERKTANKNDAEKPFSARGAPPQEKPRKKLSPLEARRARIEQQKREEAERKARISNESSVSIGADQPPPTFESKSDNKVEGASGGGGGRRPSGGRISLVENIATSTTSASVSAQQITTRNAGDEDGTLRQDAKAKNERGSDPEYNPFVTPGIDAERSAKYDNDDQGISGVNQSESAREAKTQVEAEQRTDDGDYGIDAPPANANDLLDDAVGGEGGRFQGMRSRMKKAGRGLLTKKHPSRAGAWGATSGEARGKEEQQPGSDGGMSPGLALSDRKGEGRAAGEGSEAGEAGGRYPRKGRTDGSDTESDGSALSPLISEAEKDDEFGTDSEEGSKGRKKKWRRNKGKSSNDPPIAADREVTLGHVVDRKMREMGYIRKPPVDELKNRRFLRERVAAEGAPEVHFIGEISGADGFGSGISCRFRVEGGRHWTCLAGLEEGQTHVMHTDFEEAFAPWNHPIDLHYTTKSIQGWPRLVVQVWQLDTHGRNVLRGYGFRHLPSTPGFSEVSVPCWRPSGTLQEETAAFFLGVTPRLTTEDAVFNRAWDQRCRLVTLPAGTVWIQMNSLFCNLQDQGVDNL